jgi:hypothetical protein
MITSVNSLGNSKHDGDDNSMTVQPPAIRSTQPLSLHHSLQCARLNETAHRPPPSCCPSAPGTYLLLVPRRLLHLNRGLIVTMHPHHIHTSVSNIRKYISYLHFERCFVSLGHGFEALFHLILGSKLCFTWSWVRSSASLGPGFGALLYLALGSKLCFTWSWVRRSASLGPGFESLLHLLLGSETLLDLVLVSKICSGWLFL